ncbi:tigger transposable element-derived protein 4-like [Hydra vulgaris]|uniref:Tigger transposable element-derived protein 4-like n=1 Tax=Hydra vulgaris TaxID=6087 RepID=A0ABM4CUG1_HYDVU
MDAGNVKGEKLSMFVFGKSKSPRCFKDNCSAHSNVQKLDWVELIFLPPNTTSITQLMDQGVIRSLKAKYRALAVKKQIAAFTANFNLTAKELVDIDFDICIANKSSDEDIIAEVSEHNAIETEEESDDECVGVSDNATKPSLNEAMHAVTVLENYNLYSNFGDDLMKALKDINCVIKMDLKASKRQSTVTDFFLKM